MKMLMGLLLISVSMSAGMVYEFTGSSPTGANVFTDATFKATEPSPLTGNTIYFPGPAFVCSICENVLLFPDPVAAGVTLTPATVVGYTPKGATETTPFYFAANILSTPGIYYSTPVGRPIGVLTVREVSGVVPEPSTLGLALAGVGVLALRLRRR